jgi:hypothetical protein
MSTPDIPRKYQGTRYTRERYSEGWHDGRAGKPHAHADHADEIIRQQGKSQYEAYSAGHAAGREAAVAEPSLMAWASGLLDELGQARLATLDASQLAELVARLRRLAEKIETDNQASEPRSPD